MLQNAPMKPLDLLLFRGTEIVSQTIIYLTKKQQNKKNRKAIQYSHVALIISRELFDDPRLKPGKLYTIEATYTGKNDDGVKNIEGEPFFGVQIRPVADILRVYLKPHTKAKLALAKMTHNPFRDLPPGHPQLRHLQSVFTSWCKHKWEGLRYDANPLSLLASLYCPLRRARDLLQRVLNIDDWMFCSELVAVITKTLDLLPKTVETANVLPMDLVGYDLDKAEDGGVVALWGIPHRLKIIE